jgi:large conductance mechanosensitive channel
MAKLTKEEKKALKKNKPSILKEFKAFITRGNVIDMATGVIVAGAFTKIITSLTNDIFMPWVTFLMFYFTKGEKGLLITVLNKQPYYLEEVKETTNAAGEVVEEVIQTLNPACIFINWGTLIEAIINFLLIAAIIFFTVKIIKSMRQKIDYINQKLHEKQLAEEKAKAEEAAKIAAEEAAKAAALQAIEKAKADKTKAEETSTNELLVEIINLLNK